MRNLPHHLGLVPSLLLVYVGQAVLRKVGTRIFPEKVMELDQVIVQRIIPVIVEALDQAVITTLAIIMEVDPAPLGKRGKSAVMIPARGRKHKARMEAQTLQGGKSTRQSIPETMA